MRVRAVFVSALSALAVAAPAQAATWNLQGTGDGASCTTTTHVGPSLRAAITAAVSGDGITVPQGTVNLGSDLVIGTQISIVRAGVGQTALNGQNNARGFVVTGNAIGVQISHLTIANGRAVAAAAPGTGGGVANSGTLTLDHVRITNSSASTGGAIANTANATLTLTHSLLDGNHGTGTGSAGGIYNFGHLTISDSTLWDNDGTAYGAIQSGPSTSVSLDMARTTIADNTAGAGT